MLVSDIESSTIDNYREVRARIETESGKNPFQLWYRVPTQDVELLNSQNGDSFLAATLLPAMALGESVQIRAPVSRELLEHAKVIQSLYCEWDKSLSRVSIVAPERSSREVKGKTVPNVGLFFSLGVDCFHLLMRNCVARPAGADEITHLIFLHGFDISHRTTFVYKDLLENGNKVARALQKKIVRISTNLRDFSDPIISWGRLYHGAALASYGLLLEPGFNTIYMAGGHQPRHLHPWGSHPLLDPLWSTETLRFVSEGCETGRVQKIKFLAQFPIAMETLRVCFINTNNRYNCGECEKCVRTMIGLHIAGALPNCRTFSHEIDIHSVEKLPVSWIERAFIEDLLNNLGSSDFDDELREALNRAISQGKAQDKIESELHNIAARRIAGVVSASDHTFLDQNRNYDFCDSLLAALKDDLKRVGSSIEGRMLDLGCGCGTFLHVCRNSGVNAIGLDPGSDLLAVASLRGNAGDVVRGAGEALPFRDNSFDLITSYNVIEHVQEPSQVLRESFRVLKPKGKIWLSFPDYSRCFREPHYRLLWIPLLPKTIAKMYLRMRGRTNVAYLDSIKYVTRRNIRQSFEGLDARIVDMAHLRAKTRRVETRAYCLERLHDVNRIETSYWRKLIQSFRWLGLDDDSLCGMCELVCRILLLKEKISHLKLKDFTAALTTASNPVWLIEKRS